ncbi:sulfurtransferase [Lusitaniella coriacea LEGE 07157]|uniref:Sulfurtransferase n=1 Tax=Lusitaniella coriacea LEGE 07157 TaxID=945747 RepID=A0A8J7E3S0_9CYAN|nr:sulfurtransferase [Lusitaniella coriacea]MBE9119142.1 sulfurtransferase [Lusitaniella coriacea LEGE 07157]
MENEELIVSPKALAKQLGNSQIAIADCRFSLADPQLGRQQYQTAHIPGAYYLDLNEDLSAPLQKHGGRHPLPNPERFAAKIAAMGVNFGETLVIAYDDSNMAFAARLWWLLRYLGHDRVAVLNGGWSAWVEGGYPTSAAPSQPKMGNFTPQPRKDWIVDIKTVKAKKDLQGVVLVDSRDRDRYRGEREPIDPIAGHIPGAVNMPWKEVCDSKGRLFSSEEQQERWAHLNPTDKLILYCGSGVTACVNLLSLKQAGLPPAKLYPGGWSDWCSYSISPE